MQDLSRAGELRWSVVNSIGGKKFSGPILSRAGPSASAARSFTLDYCRYQNYHSDFSETTREAFQKAMGVMVKNWPEDLYRVTDDGKDVFGPQWNQFVEWRTSVITGYVEEIGRRIKAIRPDCKFEYWAASITIPIGPASKRELPLR